MFSDWHALVLGILGAGALGLGLVALRRRGGADPRDALRASLLESHPEPFVLVDAGGGILDANRAGAELLRSLGIDDLTQAPALARLLQEPASCKAEVYVGTGPDAVILQADLLCLPELGTSRALVLRDVTALRQLEQKLVDAAHFDALTGLANRRLFEKHLAVGLSRARVSGRPLALILFDLDRFKETNDSLGHGGGDALLQAVATVTSHVVRGRDLVSRMHDASEKSGDLSRLGGDEFAVILSEISCPEDAADVAERILEALGRPVAIEGTAVSVSASAGIALFPQDASDADSLLRAADQALYHAKERGSSQCQLFQPGLNRTAQRRRAIRADLQTALDAEQIEIVYQPKVDLESGCTVGAEALARWSHPALGAVPPDEFVSVAERSGLATALGGYVVRRVCRDVRAFGYDGAGSIAINVGPDELASSEYFEQFSAALREHAVSPQTLQIEITERMLLRESLDIATNLRDLRGIGVSVYLDDFGTGRSSLADLCTHEVDGIKIDRSFICNVESDRVSASVVRALILLAQDAAIEVVAEGVENADQVGILRSMRCRLAQGYHLGKPMPADRFFERARREDSGAMPPVDDEIGGLA